MLLRWLQTICVGGVTWGWTHSGPVFAAGLAKAGAAARKITGNWPSHRIQFGFAREPKITKLWLLGGPKELIWYTFLHPPWNVLGESPLTPSASPFLQILSICQITLKQRGRRWVEGPCTILHEGCQTPRRPNNPLGLYWGRCSSITHNWRRATCFSGWTKEVLFLTRLTDGRPPPFNLTSCPRPLT